MSSTRFDSEVPLHATNAWKNEHCYTHSDEESIFDFLLYSDHYVFF